jgi:two-component system, OmpR family, sensor kinase
MTLRLGVRTRLLIAIVGAVTIALAIGVGVFNLLLGQRLSASATDLAEAQAEAELSSVQVRNGKLVAPEGPDEGTVTSQAWVFEGSRLLEAPRAPERVDEAARSLAGGPERSLRLGEETRLYAIPVTQNGVRYGTVVAAVSLDPYEETGRTALIGSLALAALLLAVITAISRWMLGRALLPVSRMTDSAARWSEHDLDHRFDLGKPYDELTRLAATLDGLLERIAASLRHEQRFTAELSHELRTPLARLKGQTELMLWRERTPQEYRAALEAIDRNVDEMTRTVETLVAAARHEAGLTQTTSDLRDAVSSAVEAARPADSPITVHVTLPKEPVRVSAEQELLTRIVQPLVDNACRYGRSTVAVELVRNGSVASVSVVDDGPGVAGDEGKRIFEPGARGSAGSAAGQGAGLGLALARRLARSAGGDVTVAPGNAGGQFSVRLPLAR